MVEILSDPAEPRGRRFRRLVAAEKKFERLVLKNVASPIKEIKIAFKPPERYGPVLLPPRAPVLSVVRDARPGDMIKKDAQIKDVSVKFYKRKK